MNYSQNDWAQWLPIAEFETNSAINESTGVSPFAATKGYQPTMGFEPPAPWAHQDSTTKRLEGTNADRVVDQIETYRRAIRKQLLWSRALQKLHADKDRMPAPTIKVGDRVMVNAKYILTQRHSRSLDAKNLGPFKVVEVINDHSFRLDFGDTALQIHPVFHPWLLHLVEEPGLIGQRQQPPGPVAVTHEGEEWEVQAVVDSKIDRRWKDPTSSSKKRGCLVYKALYTGHAVHNQKPPWQPYWDFDTCPLLLADYHHKHPNNPGPHHDFRVPKDWKPEL